MAFGLQGDIFTKQLNKLGANVVVDESTHRLIVNYKYEISYTNSYYRYLHSDKTIGQGKQAFLELIKKEMTGEPEPLITIIEEE